MKFEKKEISASIVLYKEDVNVLSATINCFLNIPESKTLFLIDNSPNNTYQEKFKNPNIIYISKHKNLGFGKGHNSVIKFLHNFTKYHLILNPDVTFKRDTISKLITQLNNNINTAMIAPRVVFPSNKHQYSCRRYPSVKELLARRFYLKKIFKQTIEKGIYLDKKLDKPFYSEYLTGCFHLYNTEDFIKLKGFDERYFMYMEDVDICKKIDAMGKKKLYYPKVTITHVLKQGSAKSPKLFLIHVVSAIKYFLKWGFK